MLSSDKMLRSDNMLPSNNMLPSDKIVAYGYNNVHGHSSCVRLSQREFDNAPRVSRMPEPGGARNAAQVDQVSPESCEECGSG
ncbi:hypothetical protein L3X38_006962 [Prunus dulcis]|uniref:Uncharacterized protein n=1 Tax=Prunus dulcis TaxID=3755 RepID=A0AAD4ZTK7_PRUDU|nr:hypothetical protein L3X38_006962 [Prunus dulcis]